MTATNLADEGHDNHHDYRSGNYITFARDGNASAEAPGSMSSSRCTRRRRITLSGAALMVLSTVLLPLTAAQATSADKCISLASSRTCPAFNESSVSTSSALTAE